MVFGTLFQARFSGSSWRNFRKPKWYSESPRTDLSVRWNQIWAVTSSSGGKIDLKTGKKGSKNRFFWSLQLTFDLNLGFLCWRCLKWKNTTCQYQNIASFYCLCPPGGKENFKKRQKWPFFQTSFFPFTFNFLFWNSRCLGMIWQHICNLQDTYFQLSFDADIPRPLFQGVKWPWILPTKNFFFENFFWPPSLMALCASTLCTHGKTKLIFLKYTLKAFTACLSKNFGHFFQGVISNWKKVKKHQKIVFFAFLLPKLQLRTPSSFATS